MSNIIRISIIRSNINEIEFLGGLGDLNAEQYEQINKFISNLGDLNKEPDEQANKLADDLVDELNHNWWAKNKSRFIN